ncbi:MAG TPA: hypothetical protein VFJ14_05070 [Nocardioidaceae bacterium]|nr:hypothetical protein [Nocardioidaceae bacterium]
MEWLWLLVAVLVLGLGAVFMSWTAGRVDRLHHRVEKARAVLDAALFHRSGTAVEIASAGIMDPATSLLLLDAGHGARASAAADRELAESDLSRALVAAFADAEEVDDLRADCGARELLDELGNACRSVELSRRFHNDVVASARALRSRRVVRWFGLAGHAPLPQTAELDDSWPPALT